MAKSQAANRRSKKNAASEKNERLKKVLEQLDAAEKEMAKAAAGTSLLHQQWRKLLRQLSFLLVLLCLHQSQEPMNQCIKDINATGEGDFTNTLLEVFQDSAQGVLSIVLAGVLAFFLSQNPPGTFQSPRFFLVTGLALIISGLYGYQVYQGTLGLGCGGSVRAEPRGFPIIAIFYVVVAICHAFMQWQAEVASKNRQTIRDLRVQHLEAAAKQQEHQGTSKEKMTTIAE